LINPNPGFPSSGYYPSLQPLGTGSANASASAATALGAGLPQSAPPFVTFSANTVSANVHQPKFGDCGCSLIATGCGVAAALPFVLILTKVLGGAKSLASKIPLLGRFFK
jgi:hypothetical protein